MILNGRHPKDRPVFRLINPFISTLKYVQRYSTACSMPYALMAMLINAWENLGVILIVGLACMGW